MTDSTETSITMVLDRSGSMESCRAATITSVNRYLLEARGDENLKEAGFELMIFDTQSLDVIRSGRMTDVKDITSEDFQPRGGTPLLDAIGRGVDRLDKKAASNKAILVIVTDGEENSSKKHNYESIKALIDDRQTKGWLIVFLGAGLSSAQQGLRMSIRRRERCQHRPRRSVARRIYGRPGRDKRGLFVEEDGSRNAGLRGVGKVHVEDARHDGRQVGRRCSPVQRSNSPTTDLKTRRSDSTESNSSVSLGLRSTTQNPCLDKLHTNLRVIC